MAQMEISLSVNLVSQKEGDSCSAEGLMGMWKQECYFEPNQVCWHRREEGARKLDGRTRRRSNETLDKFGTFGEESCIPAWRAQHLRQKGEQPATSGAVPGGALTERGTTTVPAEAVLDGAPEEWGTTTAAAGARCGGVWRGVARRHDSECAGPAAVKTRQRRRWSSCGLWRQPGFGRSEEDRECARSEE
uniref:Uncharacterized protein n=1 Tax=Oryza rufipogon TaxID=4529 RepID=A0A0E0QMR5_ORYRU